MAILSTLSKLVCSSDMQCRYNYKKDANRVYQKVVAEIQLASPGGPGVAQVHFSHMHA